VDELRRLDHFGLVRLGLSRNDRVDAGHPQLSFLERGGKQEERVPPNINRECKRLIAQMAIKPLVAEEVFAKKVTAHAKQLRVTNGGGRALARHARLLSGGFIETRARPRLGESRCADRVLQA